MVTFFVHSTGISCKNGRVFRYYYSLGFYNIIQLKFIARLNKTI